MYHKLSDEELLQELKQRFMQNRQSLEHQQVLTEELLQANEKLQASEALKSNFLSNIRNEINNPLASILGLAKSIDACGNGDNFGQARQMAQMIFQEAFNLDFQIGNIFIAAELEAGEAIPTNSLFNVASLLSDLVADFGNRAKANEVGVNLSVAKDGDWDGSFVTDPGLLRVLVANLLANAIEFSHAGGTVELLVLKKDEGMQISIQDSGPGIAPEFQKNIFDRFMQLETGRTKSHTGHGLGLSIVKALVDLQEGRLDMDSNLGKGTTFKVWLPQREDISGGVSIDANELIFDGGEEVF